MVTLGDHTVPIPLFPLLKLGEGVQDESGLGRWRIGVQTPPGSPRVDDERLEGSRDSASREAQFNRSARPMGARGRGGKDNLIFFFF